MNEEPTIWPPTPGPQHDPKMQASGSEIGVCPACKRKLLTQTSALCNWCGAKIDNPEYQERADACAVVRIDELRQQRKEEQCHFRIEHIARDAAPERTEITEMSAAMNS